MAIRPTTTTTASFSQGNLTSNRCHNEVFGLSLELVLGGVLVGDLLFFEEDFFDVLLLESVILLLALALRVSEPKNLNLALGVPLMAREPRFLIVSVEGIDWETLESFAFSLFCEDLLPDVLIHCNPCGDADIN